MKTIPARRTKAKTTAKRKRSTTTIGGITVELMPVRGKGNLPLSLIKRIVREAKASRKPGKA
ncbi:MAG: hypothetical protein K1X78_23340 [Verrucomicrobiaceae bacterium]|nr:hypothetical protein [Verrucomicrobiaceae bacterium]